MTKSNFRLICLGDVVGQPGRQGVAQLLPKLRQRYAADMVIVNGENAAGGLGPDPKTSTELRSYGADVLTSGDHVWHKKEFREFLEQNSSWAIRPANYPSGAPGRGWTVIEMKGLKVGVLNLIGRVFFNTPLDCPFAAADALLGTVLKECKVIVCDMHAEATSEKVALGRYLDGRVSLLFGTHTHVQTADTQILPKGTAYISDLGMCGGRDSVIGMDIDAAIFRFRNGLPLAYQIGSGPSVINGVFVEIDSESGRATTIERINEVCN